MVDRIAFSELNRNGACACLKAPKTRIRRVGIVACVAVLSMATARMAFPASPNPGMILQKVSSVYSRLQDYHIAAVMNNNLLRPIGSKSLHTVISLDAAGPGRVRLALTGDGPNVVIVSNGKTTWHYVPGENEYTEGEAVFLSAAPGSKRKRIVQSGLLGNMQDLLVQRFEKLGGSAKAAKFEGNAKIKFNGKKVRCYRISLRSTEVKDQFWIDQSNFLVLRENIVRTMGSRLRGSYATADLRITDIQTHAAPSPSLFSFDPPANARRLASLDMPGVLDKMVGQPLKDFTLPDVEGKQIKLSDYRGKTVLLSFWASWCLPCEHELPTIEKIYEQHKDKDVVILAVDDESEATIKKFLNDNHYGFTALIDHKRTLFRELQVGFIPTVFVINRKGIIVREIIGWQGPQQLLSALKGSK